MGGPLVNGVRSAEFPTIQLEGRHRVRVVIEGVSNSPFALGTLQLDRTPPVASSVVLTPAGGTVVADWIQGDALSGTDPASPVVVEVNASPGGDPSGAWVPFAEQPEPGDGRKVARTSLVGLADGTHVVRARTRDRAGNVGMHVLGTVTADATPPSITGLRVSVAPGAVDPVAELAFTADDGAGAGLEGPVRVGPAGRPDVDWTVGGGGVPGRVLVRLPGPGVHEVTVRAADRVGNRGESAPLAIRVPTPAEAADARVPATPALTGPGSAAGSGVRWAYAEARRFHARRGSRLDARLRVADTAAGWRRLLGDDGAGRFRGYATLRGDVLLGPEAVRGLRLLAGARGARAVRASRADLDVAASALGVLLHETLHATGPAAREDALGTRSGRAFEEGMTEAATVDLLPSFVRGLGLGPALRSRVLAAVARRRAAYPPETAWARRVSVLATQGGPVRGDGAGARARARAWRVRVADTWGADRWARLAAATGLDEATLRAGAQAAAQTTTISVPSSVEEMVRPAAGTTRATSWGV